jgi:hypothetical protein
MILTPRQYKLHYSRKSNRAGGLLYWRERYQLSGVLSEFRGGQRLFVKVTTFAAFIKSLELVMLGETIVPREILQAIDIEDGVDAEVLPIAQSSDARLLSTQERRIVRETSDMCDIDRGRLARRGEDRNLDVCGKPGGFG